jgi:hypothetical protein
MAAFPSVTLRSLQLIVVLEYHSAAYIKLKVKFFVYTPFRRTGALRADFHSFLNSALETSD